MEWKYEGQNVTASTQVSLSLGGIFFVFFLNLEISHLMAPEMKQDLENWPTVDIK